MLPVSDVIVSVTALIILLLKILKFAIWPTMSGIKGSKSDSGAAKRKRKKVDDSIVSSQKGALLRHFSRPDVSRVTDDVPSTSSTLAPCEHVEDENQPVRLGFIMMIVSDSIQYIMHSARTLQWAGPTSHRNVPFHWGGGWRPR